MAEKQDFWRIGVFVIVIFFLGIFLFKKPLITGRVVQSNENIFSENLNLQVNESGTYEWQIKNPGSIKSLKVTGSVSSNGTARVYIEKNGTRQLLFDSTKQLFDININVLPEYKKVFQGDEILIQNILFNLRGFGAGNVNVIYSIKDSKGNVIASQEETIYIETQAKFIRKLEIPPEIKPGVYTAFVEAFTNSTIVGTGSDIFEVKAKYEYKPTQELKYLLIGIGIVAVLFIFIFIIKWLGTLKKKQKIAELKERIPKEKIQKLEKELKALEEGFASRLISEKSYNKEKARIENKLNKLKSRLKT